MMNNDSKEKSIDDFLEKYKPIINTHDKYAGFDGSMFETYGTELEFVNSINETEPKRVWTLIDCDGWYGICAGYHWINRIGYVITEENWESETEEYVICNEGPVNEWFDRLAPSVMAEIMDIDQSLTPEEKDDKARDAWYDLGVDEKEEIMNNYKSKL